MMRPKVGAIHWTVGKVVNIVLLTILLVVSVLIIPQNIGALEEKGEGFMNNVLLLLGRYGSQSGNCRTIDTPVDVEDVRGEITVCKGNCSYYLGGSEELLGANRFYVTDTGYRADIIGLDHTINVGYWGEESSDSDAQKEAYGELVEVMENFYSNSESAEGLSQESFFELFSFDPGAYFTIYVEGSGGGSSRNEFYYDSEAWVVINSLGQEVERVANHNSIRDRVWGFYREGRRVTWNYRGEDVERFPVSDVADNFQEILDEIELSVWLTEKEEEIDNPDRDADEFHLHIGGERGSDGRNYLFRGGVDRYVYKNGRWRKNRIMWFNGRTGDRGIHDKIVEANLEGERIVWQFDNHSRNEWYIVMSKDIVRTRDSNENEFKRWFDETIQDYTDKLEREEVVIDDFNEYFVDSGGSPKLDVDFSGQTYDVLAEYFVDEDEFAKLLIYFEESSGDKYGMYYDGEEFVLTYGDQFRDSYIQEAFGLSDSDWEEFLKINKVFEMLRYKCYV